MPKAVKMDKDARKKLQSTVEMLELIEQHKKENKLLYFQPTEKQHQFYSFGKTKRERMFMAANGVGKSESAAFEDACHLTGMYPEWWTGVRYDHPVKMWVACETSVLTRDVLQSKLCGPYGVVSAFGTGFIPKSAFADKPSLSHGVTDSFDTIQVVHRTNGVVDGTSTCSFKSFEQERAKFQGENLDFGHCDEEPPMDVYTEFLARIRAGDNPRMMVTFTPLHGRTPLVERFEEGGPNIVIVRMSLDEATFLTQKKKDDMISGYPTHERDARRYGVPLLGSGKIFPYDEDMLREPFIEYVPAHWAKIWGIDFGVDHPFAAVLALWDRDNDIIHIHQALRFKGNANINPTFSLPSTHAAAMKQYGAMVPVAWPHDGTQRDKGGMNATLASQYKAQGLRMMPTWATFPDGGYNLEAGIKEMDDRMATGRWKVSAHLAEWFEEYRFYHRKDGLIVKERDDLLSASRIAMMMKRFAKPVALGPGMAPMRRRGKLNYAIGTGESPLDW